MYRFRYEQYFADRENLPGSDHAARRVWLPHDDCSRHFTAHTPEGVIVAAGSATPASEPSLYEEWKQIFELPKLEKLLPHLVLISRVIVAKDARNSALFGALCLHLAKIFTEEGYHYAAHYCSPAMVPMYERLGYRLYGYGKALHGGAFRLPMLLLIDDIPYLSLVRSPFRSLDRVAEASTEWVEKALEVCPELAQKPLCAMREEERVRKLVSLCPMLEADSGLLRVLRRGAIIPLRAGDVLAPAGYDEGSFFVLTGSMDVGGRHVGPGTVLYTGEKEAKALEASLVISAVFDKE